MATNGDIHLACRLNFSQCFCILEFCEQAKIYTKATLSAVIAEKLPSW